MAETTHCPECGTDDLTEAESLIGVCYDCARWLRKITDDLPRLQALSAEVCEREDMVIPAMRKKLLEQLEGQPT